MITTGQVAVKANSAVQAWTWRFKDALEEAWRITSLWMGQKTEPEVVIHTDFAAVQVDRAQISISDADAAQQGSLAGENHRGRYPL